MTNALLVRPAHSIECTYRSFGHTQSWLMRYCPEALPQGIRIRLPLNNIHLLAINQPSQLKTSSHTACPFRRSCSHTRGAERLDKELVYPLLHVCAVAEGARGVPLLREHEELVRFPLCVVSACANALVNVTRKIQG